MKLVEYSPYQEELYGVPGKYKTEMISLGREQQYRNED